MVIGKVTKPPSILLLIPTSNRNLAQAAGKQYLESFSNWLVMPDYLGDGGIEVSSSLLKVPCARFPLSFIFQPSKQVSRQT